MPAPTSSSRAPVVVSTALRSTIHPVRANSRVMATEVESRIFHSSDRREKRAIIGYSARERGGLGGRRRLRACPTILWLARSWVWPVGRLAVDHRRVIFVPLVLVRRGDVACFRNADGRKN